MVRQSVMIGFNVPLGPLSKRAEAAIAEAGIVEFTDEDAAERLLAVHGCGRKTIREIDKAVANLTGKGLGGFDRVMKGFDAKPTITTENAARSFGVEADVFLALAKKIGVTPKQRKNGLIWSEWDLCSVRHSIWKQKKIGG